MLTTARNRWVIFYLNNKHQMLSVTLMNVQVLLVVRN